MNYPIWEVSFGSGLLIAVISILHVFVSHFAVGGGLFLVLTEHRAYRTEDTALLDWLKSHSKFFVLLTVVYGAVSGVGIWFSIGLVHPAATSSLIHAYVWGWAIEWVFFFVEITAALLYLYGWNKLSRATHLRIGWIYFVAAFMSLVVINGILSFMLTPGDWIESRDFWDGILNPSYLPSLCFRTLIALALAGIYALLTAPWQQSRELRARIGAWCGLWILPSLALLPLAGVWYVNTIPESVWNYSQGRMPTASLAYELLIWFSAILAALAVIARLLPARTPFLLSVLMLAAALGSMGAFEFIREAVRKPYIIRDYLYANSIYKVPTPGDAGQNMVQLSENGVLETARWTALRGVSNPDPLEAGEELFRLQCMACHTVQGYRGLRPVIEKEQWSHAAVRARLGGLDKMFDGVMPPFAGTADEKDALAAYLAGLAPKRETPDGREAGSADEIAKAGQEAPLAAGGSPALDGDAIYTDHCEDCHDRDREDSLFVEFMQLDVAEIERLIGDLPALDEDMPPFEGTDPERAALARWIRDFSDQLD